MSVSDEVSYGGVLRELYPS